jgi:hypothetical protein
LAAVGVGAWLLAVAPVPWWLALPITLAVSAVLLSSIGHVVRVRDFD